MSTTPHPDDAALVRLVDGELPSHEAHEVERHLDGCPSCVERFRALEQRDQRVRAWLTTHDPPPPARSTYDLEPRTRRAWPRWSAAASILLAVAVAAGPARAWLLDRIGAPDDAPSVAAATPAPASGAATSFAPDPGTLRLEIVGARFPLQVVLERSPDELVHLIAPDDQSELLVRSSSVRIRDAAVPERVYRLSLPRSVSALRIVHDAGRVDSLVAISPQLTRRMVDIRGVN